MKVCCITNDLEATSIYGEAYNQSIAESVLHDALPAVLALYRKYNVRATFFCLASYIEKFPELIRMIEADGHEVACHGLVHDRDRAFDLLTEEQQVEQLQAARTILERYATMPVSSFRAPALRVNQFTPAALSKAGFCYDSSVAPQRMDIIMSFGSKHKLAWLRAPRAPYHVSETNMSRKGTLPITEVPVSSVAIPYISTVMRISSFLTAAARQLIYWETRGNNSKVVNFLFHPSEVVSADVQLARKTNGGGESQKQRLFATALRAKLKQKNLGTRSLELLEKELQFWTAKGYQFKTISDISV